MKAKAKKQGGLDDSEEDPDFQDRQDDQQINQDPQDSEVR